MPIRLLCTSAKVQSRLPFAKKQDILARKTKRDEKTEGSGVSVEPDPQRPRRPSSVLGRRRSRTYFGGRPAQRWLAWLDGEEKKVTEMEAGRVSEDEIEEREMAEAERMKQHLLQVTDSRDPEV